MALHSGDRYGYALMDEVAELTAGAIRLGPGTLYRSLQRMRVEGWVDELPDDPATTEPPPDRRAERRRTYRLTPAGHAAAIEEARRLAALVAAARRVGLTGEEG